MKLDKRLLRETGNSRKYLGLTVGIGGLTGIAAIAQAFCLNQIINGVFLLRQGLADVAIILIVWLGIIIGRAGLAWFNEIAANKAAKQVKQNLRRRLFQHLFNLGPAYSHGERSGELSNTALDGIESLDAYFSQYLPQMFLAGLVPTLVLVVVAYNDWLSGLVLMLTAPVLVIFMILIGKLAEAKTQRQWQTMSLLSAHFLDVLQGLTTLKLLGRSQRQVQTIEKVSESFRQITLSVLRIAFLSALVMELGATLSTAIVAVEIGLRLLYNQIEFSRAFFVLLLAPEFYLPLRALGARFHASMAGGEAAQRVFEILETPAKKPENGQAVPSLQTNSIQFKNVSYAYDNGERPALTNINLTINLGQKIALVGASGAGKSTIANLLLDFIEPTNGEILVGDMSLKTLTAADWRKQIAWVPQKPHLFNTSVAENIRLGKSDATLEEVIAAAKIAHAHEFIMALPEGYATKIGERGTRLSGGQAQRLGLARAFLKNAPLLILDEPTSNLDPATENLIVESLGRLMSNRTVLIIAHRLNTLQAADRVVVLHSSEIVADTTPQSLAKDGNFYQTLQSFIEFGNQEKRAVAEIESRVR